MSGPPVRGWHWPRLALEPHYFVGVVGENGARDTIGGTVCGKNLRVERWAEFLDSACTLPEDCDACAVGVLELERVELMQRRRADRRAARRARAK